MTNQTFLRNELLDLQVKADELDSENIRLTKENEKYELESKKLRTTISELHSQLCNMVERREFEELTNKFDALTDKYEQLDRNLKRQKKSHETLTNTYEHSQKSYDELESKFELARKENAELKSNLNELKAISKQALQDAGSRGEQAEEQLKVIAALQEENESLKNHLNYLKEQQHSRTNGSMISCSDSFAFEQLNNQSVCGTVPESMDIVVESKLRECQKQLEEQAAASLCEIEQLRASRDELQAAYDRLAESAEDKDSKLIDLESETVNLRLELGKQKERLSSLEEEQQRSQSEAEQLRAAKEQLASNCDQLRQGSESKDARLIDLESENKRLKLELRQATDEIERTTKRLSELDAELTQLRRTLDDQKEAALTERTALEKRAKELKQALTAARDEASQLIKLHQDEMFKLSETMVKREDDGRLRADLANALKELKGRDDRLIELQGEAEKQSELRAKLLIEIERLRANEKERNHAVYMMKQQTVAQEKQSAVYEVAIKKLEAELKCAEDSFVLERKTKERYYKELTELERRLTENRCSECTKLARSNSLSFNALTQTLTVKHPASASGQAIQKLPNPSRYMMEDEEGQFMTNTHINDVRKRKTEPGDGQEDFHKRLNILQQRNAKVAPHLKTSYALEFQGESFCCQLFGSSHFELVLRRV